MVTGQRAQRRPQSKAGSWLRQHPVEGWAPDLQPDAWEPVHGAQVEAALLFWGGSTKEQGHGGQRTWGPARGGRGGRILSFLSSCLRSLPLGQPPTTDGLAATWEQPALSDHDLKRNVCSHTHRESSRPRSVASLRGTRCSLHSRSEHAHVLFRPLRETAREAVLIKWLRARQRRGGCRNE